VDRRRHLEFGLDHLLQRGRDLMALRDGHFVVEAQVEGQLLVDYVAVQMDVVDREVWAVRPRRLV